MVRLASPASTRKGLSKLRVFFFDFVKLFFDLLQTSSTFSSTVTSTGGHRLGTTRGGTRAVSHPSARPPGFIGRPAALFPRGSSSPTPPLPPACSHQCMALTCAGSAARSPTEASRRRVTSGRGLCPFCAKFGARNSVVITDTASGMPEHWMPCWMQQCPKAPAGPPRRRRSRSRPCRRGRSALDGRWAPASSPGGRRRP